MRIARCSEEAAAFAPSVLTIGKFDGVHAGHSFLLRQVVDLARRRHLRAAALTFDPHPACVLAPQFAPRPLMSVEDRCARMRELGIEQLFILRFTQEVARLAPEEFVAQFVCGVMQARAVLVGGNFRFGHKQAGDPRLLAELGAQPELCLSDGFEVREVPPVECRGRVVSTSEVRSLLEAGRVSLAGRLLERPYALAGPVVQGRGIGSRETVPTLNLRPTVEVMPRDGVYVTRTADAAADRHWRSITNIGVRPTFGG